MCYPATGASRLKAVCTAIKRSSPKPQAPSTKYQTPSTTASAVSAVAQKQLPRHNKSVFSGYWVAYPVQNFQAYRGSPNLVQCMLLLPHPTPLPELLSHVYTALRYMPRLDARKGCLLASVWWCLLSSLVPPWLCFEPVSGYNSLQTTPQLRVTFICKQSVPTELLPAIIRKKSVPTPCKPHWPPRATQWRPRAT